MSIRIMSEVWKTKLPTSEKMVLLCIADHASDDGTEAWPSQRLISEKSSLTIRTVQRCINNLTAEGWLRMEKRAGGSATCRDDRRPNRYTINLAKLRGDIATRRKVRDDIEVIDEATLETVTGRHTRPLNHPIETPIETPDLFEIFWKAYPRKTAKGTAKKAWAKVKDPELAIAGAERYANDPNRVEQFTAHAATWLNGERWLDDPLPQRKLSPEEQKAREILEARVKADAERLRQAELDRLDRQARANAVPMPEHLKELLRRV